jgi:hypothetical protein
MGCDIHLYVERRENGKWVTCDAWEKDPGDGGRASVPYKKSFYHGRNYDLFAIFADVRNGRGFAGVKTGEGFTPISPPRGIPADCCAEYRDVAEGWGVDGHSHSWLTVADIMSYDWTQTTTKRGVVRPQEWAAWKLNGQPESWCGGIGGSGILTVSPQRMEAAAKVVTGGDLWKLFHDGGNAFKSGPLGVAVYKNLGGAGDHGEAVTEVSWTIPYYDAGSHFLGSALPRLWRLGAPEDVRIVFFFDN